MIRRLLTRWAAPDLHDQLTATELELASVREELAAANGEADDADFRYRAVHALNERNNRQRKAALSDVGRLMAEKADLRAENEHLAKELDDARAEIGQLRDAARRTAPLHLGEPTMPIYPNTTWGRLGIARSPVDDNPRYGGRPEAARHADAIEQEAAWKRYEDGLGDQ